MKILVTGREGQLVQSLVARAADTEKVVLLPVGRPDLDLEVPGSAEAAVLRIAPEVVINAAAYTAVDQAEDEPERAFRINGAAAGEVARAARVLGAPVIHISTDYVFDGLGEGAYPEDAPTAPIGIYGASKLQGELFVREANPSHAIVRTAWVYSPFGKNFLKTMLAVARARDEINVVADQRGNPSSALDLADGLLAMLRTWQTDPRKGLGETYHLTGGGDASWFEFAEAIFESARELGLPSARVRPIQTVDWPTKAARPANSVLDSSKFESTFQFRAPHWRRSTRAALQQIAAATDV